MLQINGINYVEKERDKSRATTANYIFSVLAMMSMATGSNQKASPPQVNIVEEFELIQLKKSKLSKSQRDWVVNKFHSRYKQIEDEN